MPHHYHIPNTTGEFHTITNRSGSDTETSDFLAHSQSTLKQPQSPFLPSRSSLIHAPRTKRCGSFHPEREKRQKNEMNLAHQAPRPPPIVLQPPTSTLPLAPIENPFMSGEETSHYALGLALWRRRPIAAESCGKAQKGKGGERGLDRILLSDHLASIEPQSRT